MEDSTRDRPRVIAFPPLIYAAGLMVGLFVQAIFPVHFVPSALAPILGWLLIGLATLLALLAFRAMHRAGTNVNPYKSASGLVVRGPFRFTRNPIYLAFSLLYGGIALLANALWAMALLSVVLVVMRRGVIEREERYLEQKFGQEYLRYKESVRRWI